VLFSSARRRVSWLLSLGLLPVIAHAQIASSEYAARRSALMARINSGGVIAFGGVEPVNYWPTFQQLPGFQYLTGFDETDAALVMVKRDGVLR
jgi:Xaa-Pro aminopeptidase